MRNTRKHYSSPRRELLAKPVLAPAEWAHVVRVLRFSQQQARITELILHAKRDKEIAAALGVNVWTIRTHLSRIFARLDVADRVELLLLVFAVARSQDSVAATTCTSK